MAEWKGNPAWTPMEQINGGEEFTADDILTPEELNALVGNMQYLYENGGDFEVNPYPIGSVYTSFSGASPASLFGGGWTQLKSKFLLSADITAYSGATPTYNGATSGGIASHTHTLDNGFAKFVPKTTGYSYASVKEGVDKYTPNYANETETTSYTDFDRWTVSAGVSLGGSTDNTNNMPPYEVVFRWRRIS